MAYSLRTINLNFAAAGNHTILFLYRRADGVVANFSVDNISLIAGGTGGCPTPSGSPPITPTPPVSPSPTCSPAEEDIRQRPRRHGEAGGTRHRQTLRRRHHGITIPFPVSIGTNYTSAVVESNGTLQFTGDTTVFTRGCNPLRTSTMAGRSSRTMTTCGRTTGDAMRGTGCGIYTSVTAMRRTASSNLMANGFLRKEGNANFEIQLRESQTPSTSFTGPPWTTERSRRRHTVERRRPATQFRAVRQR